MLASCSFIGSYYDILAWAKPFSGVKLASAGQGLLVILNNTLTKTLDCYEKAAMPRSYIRCLHLDLLTIVIVLRFDLIPTNVQ